MFRKYYLLMKPGIVFGNAVTAFGGYALAAKGTFNPFLLSAMLLGLSLIVAAGCVLNNYLDRFSDQKMARTQNRPLAKGTISPQHALLFAALLLSVGTLALFALTNWLATLVALLGFVVYVAFYSVLKYRTVYGTAIGSIAGAIPPVVGYTALHPALDLAALLLFLIVVFWQMPHFFAIALYRMRDYASASIPVLPLVRGLQVTQVRMVLYVLAFALTASMLPLLGYVGYTYFAALILLSGGWLWLSLQGFKSANVPAWARKMFLLSLVVILGISAMLAFDSV